MKKKIITTENIDALLTDTVEERNGKYKVEDDEKAKGKKEDICPECKSNELLVLSKDDFTIRYQCTKCKKNFNALVNKDMLF